MTSRLLVTGAAGFIGSHLAEHLLQAGGSVRGLDNLSTGRRGHLDPRVEFLEGDLRDAEACVRACAGVETVFHLAAMASVPRSIESPAETMDVNVVGTVHLLESARRAGVRRLILASSSSVYGDAPQPAKSEDLPPRPLSPYAISKLAAEHLCRCATEVYGFETVVLRFFNVYGPGQDPRSAYAAVIPLFLSQALSGTPLTIHGDGGQTRDFTYVGDVVRGLEMAARAEEIPGLVINLAGGAPVSIRELAAHISRIAGVPLRTEAHPVRTGDIRHSCADVTRARDLLRFRADVPIGEGLERTAAWFRRVAGG
jgi:nucleoside-diphosphate-sugar epimerase